MFKTQLKVDRTLRDTHLNPAAQSLTRQGSKVALVYQRDCPRGRHHELRNGETGAFAGVNF